MSSLKKASNRFSEIDNPIPDTALRTSFKESCAFSVF